jgi:hypothetical protein
VSPAAPAIRRVLAAYSSSHTEILPSNQNSFWVPTVTSTADSARIHAALAPLITSRKIEVSSVGDKDFFSLPATGAATSADVLSAFLAAGFSKAIDMTGALMDRHNARLYSHEELHEIQGLWTQTVSRTPDVLRQTERPLTSEEAAEARLVFGPGLDYAAIRITEDSVAGVGNTARTLPSTIYFPVGASSAGAYIPWLIHELTHSWQYQHGRSVVATGTRAVLCWIHISSYNYGGKPALASATAAGKGLSSFHTEQQGNIARDDYNDLKAGASVAEYAPFLTEFRTPP